MKFFENLPSTSFQSTIGTFTISDFFTYLDVDSVKITEANVPIDNKTTLLEAAYNVYGDANSFWAFVAANNVVNPFDLLNLNTTIYKKIEENKINFLLMPSSIAVTGGSAFPVGSLIMPYGVTSGTESEYGYTGNFNLNGAVAVIEETSFYDGNMTIGNQLGGTGPFIVVGAASEHVTVLRKNSYGGYSYAGDYYVTNKKQADSKTVSIVKTADAKTIYKQSTSANTTLDELLPATTPIAGSTAIYSALQTVDNQKKIIKAYIPSDLGLIQSSFVTTKYS